MSKKPVAYELIDPNVNSSVYDLLSVLIDQHHRRLTNAAIGLAWHRGLKPDVDGRITLGKVRKCSDLDRELAHFAFVIVLNRDFWLDTRTSNAQRRALLDHELCHCEVALDENQEPRRDARDRIVYRTRKHDIEEFSDIVRRHGIYRHEIESFAASLDVGRKQGKLFDEIVPRDSSITSISITDEDGSGIKITKDNVTPISRPKGKVKPPKAEPEPSTRAVSVTSAPKSCAECGSPVSMLDASGVYVCTDKHGLGCAWSAVVEAAQGAMA